MSQKISANLENLVNQQKKTDLINASKNQGFKEQKRKIYIYTCRDYYNIKRATVNDLSNQIFFWKATKYKEKEAYILNEVKDNSSFSFSASVIGNALSYDMNIDELLDTENRTFIITFEPLQIHTKVENIFYITSITNKNTGSKQLDYIYSLSSIGTIEIGEASYIKIIPSENIPDNIEKRIKRVEVKPQEKWIFGGFDSNLKGRVSNVIPVWTNILKVSNGTIDYINLWENDKWIINWNELEQITETNTITLKKTVSLEKLFTFNNKVFTPAIDIVKKILQLNISSIRRFEGLNLSANINIIGESPGIFWKNLLDGKGAVEIAGILNSYIQEELKLWKQGSYRGEIESNNPFGKIKVFSPETPTFSNKILNRTLSVLCMLSSQIYSPYSLLGGRNEASKFLLLYDLEIDESLTQYNSDIGLFEFSEQALNNIELTSGYLTFGYPFFTTEQIEEFSQTGEVSDYNTGGGETKEDKYGSVNPFLQPGDAIISRETINESTTVNQFLSYTRSAALTGSSDVYAFGNNPVVFVLSELSAGGEWKNSDIGTAKFKPVKLLYKYSTLDGYLGGNLEINFNESNATNLSIITFNDIRNYNSILCGYIEDGTPNPKTEDYQKFEELGYKVPEAIKLKGEIKGKDRVLELLNEVESNANKEFIGTPTYEFTVKGDVSLVGFGPLRNWAFGIESYRIRAVIATGNTSVLDTIAQRKGISRLELDKQILEDSKPKFKNLELENEGLRIEVIDQFFKTDVMNETLEEQTYITLPIGITGDNISQTWIYLNNTNDLEKTLSEINNNKQIDNNFIESKYTVNFLEEGTLNYIKFFGIFSSIAEVSLILEDETRLSYQLVLGDRVNEANTSTNLVFYLKEQEI